MQPEKTASSPSPSALHQVFQVTRKEVGQFFHSPVAFVFIGTFLAVCLFDFFWVNAFFARNIADLRPLFEAMPLLLIFLVSALTMRMWADERRMGTLEFLLTLPVTPARLVAGKFLACVVLVATALVLTLPLALTVSWLGDLDWGPVMGAWLAALLLGAAYCAIGLWVSCRTDSQIVSLILTVLVCLAFYLAGSPLLTGLLSPEIGGLLESLSTRTRFDSITRGVLDIRDLYYYLSLTGVFLALNVLDLERLRWSPEAVSRQHHRSWYLLAGLLIANLVLGNLLLQPVQTLRADLTADQRYSISDSTRNLLERLDEPLLLRGYFSEKTHPLLAPLVPRLRDLLEEYQVAGGQKIRVEFADPQTDAELEDEANNKYSIRPVPFQISDKYEAALVNAYFHVLVRYGDEFEVLDFRDLIEVREDTGSSLDVGLRNPEYDVTKAIRKTLTAFRSSGELFAAIPRPVTLTAYVSASNSLPPELQPLFSALEDVLGAFEQEGDGRFRASIIDPQAGDGEVAGKILEQYGMQPMAMNLLSSEQFYFYLMLDDGEQVVQVALPEQIDSEALRRNIEAGLKRYAQRITRRVGVLMPVSDPNPYAPPGNQRKFELLREQLLATLAVKNVTLEDGRVPEDIDLLLLAAPENLSEKQLFAADQFLMQGGTVIAITSPLGTELSRNALQGVPYSSGLQEWLQHHGIRIEETFVLDPVNARFPIPVTREVGGFQFQEVALLDYPYFADLRGEQLVEDHPITSGISQLTMAWPSPVDAEAAKEKGRSVTPLLRTSPGSWRSDDQELTPRSGETSDVILWPPADKTGAETIAVLVEGSFDSWFAKRGSPLLTADAGNGDDAKPEAVDGQDNPDAAASPEAGTQPVYTGLLAHSPEAARLIVFASNEFVTDQTINLISSVERSLYFNSLELVQNAVDWSVEDRDLLSIRSRSQFANTLPPIDRDAQRFWEYLNYGLILGALALLWLGSRTIQSRRQRRQHDLVNEQEKYAV